VYTAKNNNSYDIPNQTITPVDIPQNI